MPELLYPTRLSVYLPYISLFILIGPLNLIKFNFILPAMKSNVNRIFIMAKQIFISLWVLCKHSLIVASHYHLFEQRRVFRKWDERIFRIFILDMRFTVIRKIFGLLPFKNCSYAPLSSILSFFVWWTNVKSFSTWFALIWRKQVSVLVFRTEKQYSIFVYSWFLPSFFCNNQPWRKRCKLPFRVSIEILLQKTINICIVLSICSLLTSSQKYKPSKQTTRYRRNSQMWAYFAT